MLKPTIVILALFASNLSSAHQVIGVSDGDTLVVLMDRKPVKIRLSDVDAPEAKQDFGARAKQALSGLCFGKDATLAIRATDRYGRIVARVTCGGVDVSRALVENGMAWHYTRYSDDAALSVLQEQARDAKRGLWAGPSPVAPWDFRRK